MMVLRLWSFFCVSLLGLSVNALAATQVAVTIDDLPIHGKVPMSISRVEVAKKMLSVLRRHRVPEVYGFINAAKLKDDPGAREVLRLWTEAGYPLGNHVYSHPDLVKSSIKGFEDEIELNEPALKEFGGAFDWHYFRYPFLREGETLEKRTAIRKFLRSKRYRIAQVTIDFEDWSWNEPYAFCADKGDEKAISWLKSTYLQNAVDQLERAKIIATSLFKRPIPHILLLHVGAFDAEMLDQLFTEYERHDVRFIPLSTAVQDEIYSLDPAVTGVYGTEFTYQVMKSRGLSLKDVGLERYTHYPEAQLAQVCR